MGDASDVTEGGEEIERGATDGGAQNQTGVPAPSSAPSHKIFVGGLSRSATEESLIVRAHRRASRRTSP